MSSDNESVIRILVDSSNSPSRANLLDFDVTFRRISHSSLVEFSPALQRLRGADRDEIFF